MNLGEVRGGGGGVALHPHGEREHYQEQNQCGGDSNVNRALPLLESKKSPLLLDKRLKQSDERNLFVQRSVAQGDSRLSAEDLEHFLMCGGKKIGVAAFERKDADAAFFICEQERVKGAHPTLLEVA